MQRILQRWQYSLLILPLMIEELTARPHRHDFRARAESPPAPPMPTSSTMTPLEPDIAVLGSSSSEIPAAASATLPALPASPTAHESGVASPVVVSSADQRRATNVVNYYFLLLGIFVALLIFVYWILIRRRRNRKLVSAYGRQSALVADLSYRGREPQTGWRAGGFQGRARAWRWRYGGSSLRGESLRREEGLDERGEAPPPYLAKPPTAVTVDTRQGHGEGEGIELQGVGHADRTRPPDYSLPLIAPSPSRG